MNTALYQDKASSSLAHSVNQLMSQTAAGNNWSSYHNPHSLRINSPQPAPSSVSASGSASGSALGPSKPPQLNTASVPRPPPDSLYSSGASSSGGGLTDGRSTNATNSVRTTSTGQTSPPGSAGRASRGGGPDLYIDSANTRRALLMEEALAKHYTFLKAYLARSYKEDQNTTRTNRAKDKLLRLTIIQFRELSTDVYDESQRREDEKYRGGQGIAGKAVPSYLPPKKNFHPKRNSARQKLATLPIDRFRQLATDVLYELERRYPRFLTGADADRIASPTFSTVSSNIPSRTRTPNGSMGGSNIASMYASGVSQGSYNGNRANSATSGLPLVGMLGVPTEGDAGANGNSININNNNNNNINNSNALRPLPKTSQSNIIVPKKSTLVEDDDDDQSDDDEDAFGLEKAANSSAAAAQAREDKARLDDYEFEIVKMKEKMSSLEDNIQGKDDHIETLEQSQKQLQSALKSNRGEQEQLTANLEKQLEEARELNDSLQTDLENLRADKARSEHNLQQELEDLRKHNDSRDVGEVEEWKERYADLQAEYMKQKEVTDSVRRDAAQFLQEMRELSERSDVVVENEERLASQVSRLEDEVKNWKGRYARAKAQSRALRSSSTGLMAVKGFGAELEEELLQGGIVRSNGVVKDIHLTAFQSSIDDFLRKSREQSTSKSDSNGNSGSVAILGGMKDVIRCVKGVLRDLDESDGSSAHHMANGGNIDGQERNLASPQNKLRMGINATANNLITATQNHVSSGGLSPVSLLDAAASHLTTAMIQLVRIMGLRRTTHGDDDDLITTENTVNGNNNLRSLDAGQDRLIQNQTNGYYNHHPQTNGVNNGYHANNVDDLANSPANSPAGDSWTVKPGERFPLPSQPTAASSETRKGLEDLRTYLQDENAFLVRTVQPLVQMLRSTPSVMSLSTDDESSISKYVGEVGITVHRICQRTMNVMTDAHNPALERHAGPIVANLEECRGELEYYGGGGSTNGIGGGDGTLISNTAREKIPPISFKVARVTKELITVIEGVEKGELTATGGSTSLAGSRY